MSRASHIEQAYKLLIVKILRWLYQRFQNADVVLTMGLQVFAARTSHSSVFIMATVVTADRSLRLPWTADKS